MKIDYEKVIAVTNRHLCRIPLVQQVEKICRLHPAGIILREKDLPEDEYEALARQVQTVCQAFQVPLTLHNYPEAAINLGIRRIHLPLHRLKEWRTRQDSFQEAGQGTKTDPYTVKFDTIGSSVHSPQEAQQAQALGASYVSAGHVFATDCKKGLPPRGLDFLRSVCDAVDIPVYAIGGINLEPEKIRAALDCGAAGVCIMSGMMGELPDPDHI